MTPIPYGHAEKSPDKWRQVLISTKSELSSAAFQSFTHYSTAVTFLYLWIAGLFQHALMPES